MTEINQTIKKAAEILKNGGVVAFPTETVYGLGAMAYNGEAVKKIFKIKGRPANNPLIVHVNGIEMAREFVPCMPEAAKTLTDKFWPGPLTLIMKRSDKIPPIVSAGLDTVAVRSPYHAVACALIRELNSPIAAPSANKSGRPSPTSAEDVKRELGSAVDMIIDGGNSSIGIESTVVDLTSDIARVLRPGAVTLEMLSAVIGTIIPHGVRWHGGASEKITSPGLAHRHYAPNLKVVIVQKETLKTSVNEWLNSNKKLGILYLKNGFKPDGERLYGKFLYRRMILDEEDYCRNLFKVFIEAENAGIEVLLVEGVKKVGLGTAIMDRLERASADCEPLGEKNPA